VDVKEELHRAVDELTDERAPAALAYLRALLGDGPPSEPSRAGDRLARRMGPLLVSGRAFFAAPAAELSALLAQQGAKPVTDFDDLLGDFWPEDETADEFIAAVRRWRHEGGRA
jgi:hypothetical protein